MKKILPWFLLFPLIANACPVCLPALWGWIGMHTVVIAEVGTVAYTANQVIQLTSTVSKDVKATEVKSAK